MSSYKFWSVRKFIQQLFTTRMSIETGQESSVAAMKSSPSKRNSEKHGKSEKKHESKQNKKRKREQGAADETKKHKSKKHRTQKLNEAPISDAPRDTESTGSPFHAQTSSIYLPLAPISQRQPLEGICAEHLSPLILTYYPPLNGVILSYSNARIAERPFEDDCNQTLLQCIDEYGAAFAWVTAEFLLFKPERGAWLEGYINLQNEGHLGLVCWNLFNASIERQRLPKEWKWVGVESSRESSTMNGGYAEDGMGHYVDGDGKKVEGTIRFRVKEIESSHDRERGFLSIAGTMLDDKAEKEVLEREYLANRGKDAAGRRLGGARALGATSLGVPAEPNPDDMDGGGGLFKHRRKY
jgi:DNA-directed RNA polymerase I subunit RPA43